MNSNLHLAGRPKLVAHADWGSNAAKRSLVISVWKNGRYTALPPSRVDRPHALLQTLRELAGPHGSIFLGFDFPIGLPIRYAEKVGISNFRTALPLFGRGNGPHFTYRPLRPVKFIYIVRSTRQNRAARVTSSWLKPWVLATSRICAANVS